MASTSVDSWLGEADLQDLPLEGPSSWPPSSEITPLLSGRPLPSPSLLSDPPLALDEHLDSLGEGEIELYTGGLEPLPTASDDQRSTPRCVKRANTFLGPCHMEGSLLWPSSLTTAGPPPQKRSKSEPVLASTPRFTCRFPSCGKVYASTDGVRRHCRKQHLNWLLALGNGRPTQFACAIGDDGDDGALL